ncbi:hypothetical protein [Streptomyces sp. NPDC001401]|uniref:hypothetical protein n=1 Tax=Streptomyces sp. NPDC001401 TaxID=3364570 RepID=UPI003683BCCE
MGTTGLAIADAHPGSKGEAVARVSKSAGVNKSPREVLPVWCRAKTEKPFHTTSSSPLYAQGEITECGEPAPDLCKLDVALEGRAPGAGSWHVYADKSTGWTTCRAGLKKSAGYKCIHIIARQEFRTHIYLSIQYHGRSNVAQAESATHTEYCE